MKENSKYATLSKPSLVKIENTGLKG